MMGGFRAFHFWFFFARDGFQFESRAVVVRRTEGIRTVSARADAEFHGDHETACRGSAA